MQRPTEPSRQTSPQAQAGGSGPDAGAPVRHLRSLVLSWRDDETGDELTVDVRGNERFLAGLSTLGFVPMGLRDPRKSSGAAVRRTATSSPRAEASAPAVHRAGEPAGAGSPGDSARTPAGPAVALEASENMVRWTARLSRTWKSKPA